ncbi:hypothetical protein BDQ17DRAFT_262505 [Cyathus striatus]|nr:hypothetical protein BDQ17DRAFT_262505 [Cyathus striatus]
MYTDRMNHNLIPAIAHNPIKPCMPKVIPMCPKVIPKAQNSEYKETSPPCITNHEQHGRSALPRIRDEKVEVSDGSGRPYAKFVDEGKLISSGVSSNCMAGVDKDVDIVEEGPETVEVTFAIDFFLLFLPTLPPTTPPTIAPTITRIITMIRTNPRFVFQNGSRCDDIAYVRSSLG